MGVEINQLKKGDYLLHKDEPCIIKDIGLVVFGTHSHAKMKLTVHGLFTGLNETISFPLHHRVEQVEIIRKAAQLLSKTEASAQIMDNVSYETKDAQAAKELLEQLQEGDVITYVEFNNTARVLEKRSSPS